MKLVLMEKALKAKMNIIFLPNIRVCIWSTFIYYNNEAIKQDWKKIYSHYALSHLLMLAPKESFSFWLYYRSSTQLWSSQFPSLAPVPPANADNDPDLFSKML